jgi:hypothetical protein
MHHTALSVESVRNHLVVFRIRAIEMTEQRVSN